MLVNARIREAGLFFNGHYNTCCIRVILNTRGGGASLDIPIDRTEEFMSMFEDDLDLENGVFVNQLKGVPVVLRTNGDEFGKITGIGSLFDREDELFGYAD